MTDQVLTAKDLYPGLERDGWFYRAADYDPIIKSFGEAVVVLEEEGYSGDTFVLYHFNEGWGLLIFGWGSCSGCDALQACSSYQDIDELIEELRSQIKRFPTLEDVKSYVTNKPINEGSWYYHGDSWHDFAAEVVAFNSDSNA